MLSGGEKLLRSYLKKSIKNEVPEYNCRNSGIYNPETNMPLEIDIYYKKIKLGFEFHGLQHKTIKEQSDRDKIKRKQCKELGITLIEIWTTTMTRDDFFEYIFSKLNEEQKKKVSKPKGEYASWFREKAEEYSRNIKKFNGKLNDKTKFIKFKRRGK